MTDTAPVRLADIAQVVRSKNAGPFMLTFDILFESEEHLERVRRCGGLTRETVAAAYGVAPDEILSFGYHAFARAVKFSMRRLVPSGNPGDTDVYGAQQHAPLLTLEVAL